MVKSKIEEIVEHLKAMHNKRKSIIELIKKNETVKLFHKCEPSDIGDKKIVAVDGGLIKRSFHGIDIVLVRAVAVCFFYKKGKLTNVSYFPSKSPVPEPYIQESISDIDWIYFTSLIRQKTEIKTVIESIETFSPDILLLDGPIVPHHSTKPSSNSSQFQLFQDVIKLCKSLHKQAEQYDIMFAGIIEDSRSSRFCEIIKNFLSPSDETISILNKTMDTPLLYNLLERNMCSVPFPYTEHPEKHPVLKDFEYAKKFYSFYLKTAQYDRPIRVDFIKRNGEKYTQELASVLLTISGQNPHYGIPAPLIEADNAAKLSEIDMEHFYSHLLSYTGQLPEVMKLRRDERPF